MDTSSDLQTKYQKIASEYSKIRAQMAVLKTAVLEERSQNAELKDFVKSKDQGLRKAEQEMDSLNFRNQQLAKRVAFLQDELDAMQVKSKKGKSRGSSVNSHEAEQANHILDEEFRNKIEENARLLSLIQDKDMAHEQEVAALMQRLKRLEHEQQQQEQISQASEEKLKSMIERLEKENSRLLSKDNSLETLSGELNSPQLGKHLITNTTIQQDSPTRDTRKSELTAPSLNLKHQQQLHVEALTQVGHYVRDLTSALSDYHTYTEQRLHAVWDQLSPANIKFSSHLKENARHLRSLDQAYSEFLQGLEDSGDHSLHSETRPVLQSLVSQLANYSNYLQKLLPYQDLRYNVCRSHFAKASALDKIVYTVCLTKSLWSQEILSQEMSCRQCMCESRFALTEVPESNLTHGYIGTGSRFAPSRESCAVPKERRLKICANWMRSISSVWKLKELLFGARLKVCGVLGHVLETCYPLPLSPSFGSPTSRAHDIVVNYIMAGFSNTDTHCTLNTSLQEESLMVSSTESLRESNSAVSQYITGFTSHFVKLERCVKMLALQDLSRAWSHKRSIEQQLPTSSERLRTTNACLVNALSAVSSSIGKLSGLLLDSRSELCSLPSNEFPSEILKYSHPAVAGEDEIKGKEQADNDLMSQESFSKQLSGVTQRATKLEQEREHWRLEYQLLQLKYDKASACAKVALRVSHFLLMNSNGMKPRSGDLAVMIDFLKETANTSLSSGSNKLNEFENKLKAGNLERNNIQTALNSFDRPAPTSVTNMLGSLDCPLPPLQAEAEAREQEVKNYFTNRINELVVVSQETETKAAILAGEHRLELCQSGKQQSAEDLSEALEKLTRLQEELQTTTENYEVQLSIMSEHLANMNEKLTLQRDEIDQLKYQLTSKDWRKQEKLLRQSGGDSSNVRYRLHRWIWGLWLEGTLSGLIGVPSTTRFINKGKRENMRHPMAEGVVEQGSIVGLIGPNLHHAGLVDSLFMSPNPDSKPVFRFTKDYFKSRGRKPNKTFPVKHGKYGKLIQDLWSRPWKNCMLRVVVDGGCYGPLRVISTRRAPYESYGAGNNYLVTSYAWDGNSWPGNKFWGGKFSCTGDLVAASIIYPHLQVHSAILNRRLTRNISIIGAGKGDVALVPVEGGKKEEELET
uniref:Protein phosphatase 1 regulatory subunit 21 n=1 Tax=Timema cristinae TaxID=61476 RepID=A0A7R9D2N7_TIMCR|nr:unnamed protein product [Timema cristinae]